MKNPDPKKKSPHPKPARTGKDIKEQAGTSEPSTTITEQAASEERPVSKSVQEDHGASKAIVNPGPDGDQ